MTHQDYIKANNIQRCIRNKQYYVDLLKNGKVLLAINEEDIVNEEFKAVLEDVAFDKEIEVFKYKIMHHLLEQIAELEKEFNE